MHSYFLYWLERKCGKFKHSKSLVPTRFLKAILNLIQFKFPQTSNLKRPLDIARRVCSLNSDLENVDKNMIVAEFLMNYPVHRFVIRRIQTNAWAPYSEIQDNLIEEACKPIDMLRCKLSFFGASKFDPKSDRWVRVNLFQGAPLRGELNDRENDDWWMPVLDYS